ncbi:hypothetical protein AMR53_02605 [Thermococcus thioreducens]|nr:hypothetical protein AMR53_02605 [Thermococcus thioreducens]
MDFVKELNAKANSTERAHDLEAYLRVLEFTKKSTPENMRKGLMGDELPKVLYETLESWGMNKRRASLKEYDDFKKELQSAVSLIDGSLLESSIEVFKDVNSPTVMNVLRFYGSLKVTRTKTKLVGNSKLMHFLFPNLIVPIDRTYTIRALGIPDFWLEIEKCAFLTIHRWAGEFVEENREFLQKLIEADTGSGWNQTIPKVVDNLIIYYVKTQL